MEREFCRPNDVYKLNDIHIDDDDDEVGVDDEDDGGSGGDEEGCRDYVSSQTRQEYCGNCGFHRNHHLSVLVDDLKKGGDENGGYDPYCLRAAWVLTLLHMHGTPAVDPEAKRARGDGDSKKARRSKFSEEQKQSMRAFAESLGWSLRNRSREAEIDAFCEEIGISKFVFKTWINNNKKIYAGSTSSGIH